MKKIFTNKFLIIIAIFTVSLFIGCTSSFASEETTTVESLTTTLYDGSEFVITNTDILSFKNILVLSCKYSDKYYAIHVLTSNEGAFSINEYDGDKFTYCCVDENLNTVPYYSFSKSGALTLSSAKTTINDMAIGSSTAGISSTNIPYYLDNISYSSYDVLTYDTVNAVTTSEVLLSSTTGNGSFFQPPPVETILTPIVAETPLEETMKEILGILPVVLVVIVVLLAMRKAIAFLTKTLKQG